MAITISEETEENVSAAWYASIPEQYRWTGKERKGADYCAAAIILPPPPGPLLAKFFASIKQHLTKAQAHAKAVREAACRPKPQAFRPRIGKSKARVKPPLPPVLASPQK